MNIFTAEIRHYISLLIGNRAISDEVWTKVLARMDNPELALPEHEVTLTAGDLEELRSHALDVLDELTKQTDGDTGDDELPERARDRQNGRRTDSRYLRIPHRHSNSKKALAGKLRSLTDEQCCEHYSIRRFRRERAEVTV